MLDLILEYRAELQHIVGLLLGLAMWVWGSQPERCLGLVFTLVIIAPVVVLRTFGQASVMFGDLGPIYIVIDLIACLCLITIALNANRNYPLWIAGFQVVAVAAHMVRGFGDVVAPLAYAILVIGPSYFQLAIMAAGLFRHVRRERTCGKYRDWRVPIRQPWPLSTNG